MMRWSRLEAMDWVMLIAVFLVFHWAIGGHIDATLGNPLQGIEPGEDSTTPRLYAECAECETCVNDEELRAQYERIFTQSIEWNHNLTQTKNDVVKGQYSLAKCEEDLNAVKSNPWGMWWIVVLAIVMIIMVRMMLRDPYTQQEKKLQKENKKKIKRGWQI